MFKKTVKWTSRKTGELYKKTLYFDLSEADVAEMWFKSATFEGMDLKDKSKIKPRDGISRRVESVMKSGSGKDIHELFVWLVQASLGEFVGEGEDEEFRRYNDEEFTKWRNSGAGDTFMAWILYNADEAAKFFKEIMPRRIQDEQAKREELLYEFEKKSGE